MQILRSLGAVIAGFVAVAVLSVGADMALIALGVFPSGTDAAGYASWMLLLALAYTLLFSACGGYLAARLAPNRPLGHAVVLALLGLAGGLAGAFANWGIMPHWYCVASVIAGPAGALLGGHLRARKR